MNPPSHLPPPSTLMPMSEPSPVTAFSNVGALNSMNGIQAALQLATVINQIQNPISGPQSSQHQSTTSGSVNTTDLLTLLCQLQQGGTTSGSSAGLTSNPPSALIPGPPVGAYPNDEDLLVQALQESEEKGLTYRKALEGLHGVNHHLASQWKDYYLDNVQRINRRVSLPRDSDRPPVVAKKPSFDTSAKARASSSSRLGHKPTPREQVAFRRPPDANIARHDAPSGSSKIPSRSPTPPPPGPEYSQGRNRFTEADKLYLVQYGRYRLAKDPQASKTEICAGLARNAPQHSATSWSSHWHFHRDVYNQKLNLTSTGDPALHDDFERFERSRDSESDYNDESDTDSEADRQNMGSSGGTVTAADKRVIARYIASFGREWAAMSGKDRWDPFAAMYPQRSAKSWQEAYRRFEPALSTMVKKYRKKRLSEVKAQTGRPTWASQNSRSPSAKRARDNEDSEDEYNPHKRAKDVV